jgi:hypothetical protein
MFNHQRDNWHYEMNSSSFHSGKRFLEVAEVKIRPEMPSEPTPQDLLQEAELL